MKADELKGKSRDELTEELHGLRKESFNLSFQKVNGQLENTARINEVRKSIAVIKTILTQKKNEMIKENSKNA